MDMDEVIGGGWEERDRNILSQSQTALEILLAVKLWSSHVSLIGILIAEENICIIWYTVVQFGRFKTLKAQ